jgi:hypothetical protein
MIAVTKAARMRSWLCSQHLRNSRSPRLSPKYLSSCRRRLITCLPLLRLSRSDAQLTFYANSRLQQISLFRSVYCLLITGHYPITVHFLSQDGAFGTVHWDFKPRLQLTRIFPSTNTCHSDSFKLRGIAIAQKTSTLRWNGA